ncbi:GIY-YIG nuclease family protein [Peribacillus frigoritolerans]|uniref:GIY-YIG nuclease family protein n=2 Tax=Peribacillus frigoritolerans TaxID=450367 RepID=UPI002079CCA4|nr:GIY-YIG nuclease family protein [Peribacillus frigoritolerans]USK63434.1 GIY-YIG nuclease family protein [Peribacillus frigoritolerans]
MKISYLLSQKGADNMGLLSKFFGNKKQEKQNDNQIDLEDVRELLKREKKNKPPENTNDVRIGMGVSFNISSDENENYGLSISSSPVGVSTGSTATDFYVYEWFIKNTGEIFYVGKGRGNRYKVFHERAYEAEKIREIYDTDSRFVGTGLTEEQAIELEDKEITRILNETNDRLTNRIIPFFTKRGNGYDRSPNTPELQFETASYLYASEIDEHYFGIKSRSFDEVKYENLKAVVFITRNVRDEISIIYGGKLDKYQSETIALLSTNGNKILKSKYAKSVTAWIYIGDDYVTNYEIGQGKALEKLGRNIPTYHLIDVWKFLKEKFGEVETVSTEEITINPIHNRVPLKDIKNLYDWEKGFDEGMPYWEKGDKERKTGNLERAIELFDKARYNGYNAPALYRSYAMTYRKLKNYDNEIAIIDEALERLRSEKINVNEMELKERRAKALALKQKQNSSGR